MKPWLVQRGTFRPEIYITEDITKDMLGSLVNFDYMGSAEFEFGALFKARKYIADNLTQYKVFRSKLKTLPKYPHPVLIICKEEMFDDVEAFLLEASKGKVRLKERMEFEYLFRTSEWDSSYADADFWWDIDNGWLCFLNKDKAVEKVTTALGIQNTYSTAKPKVKQILFVDDEKNPQDKNDLSDLLAFTIARNLTQARELLSKNRYDELQLDFVLDSETGNELLEWLMEHKQFIPKKIRSISSMYNSSFVSKMEIVQNAGIAYNA